MPSSRDHLRRRGAGNGSATDGFKRVRGRALDFLTVVTTHVSFWMPVLLFCSGRTAVNAQDLLPPDSDIVTVIDHYIQQKLASTSIPVVAPADDMSLLRRTTLDLAGRVPTATDRKWFMSLPEGERRRQLVDRLMHLPDYDFHLRNWLDETLLPNQRFDDDFRAYLLTAVRSRRNWDTIFREIIRASAVDGPDKGASKFVMSRVRELDDLTNDTAVLFFGVNISCAKCHDHPLVPDWKQDHFYGMQAFFSRTYPTRKMNTIS